MDIIAVWLMDIFFPVLSFLPDCGMNCRLDRYADSGPLSPMHLGHKEHAVCAPLLVSPIISRGAPRQTCETSVSGRWNYERE
jgi:hypothetical protein